MTVSESIESSTTPQQQLNHEADIEESENEAESESEGEPPFPPIPIPELYGHEI